MIGIYKITNKVNGKHYIGASVNVAVRWQQHIISMANGMHFKKFQKDYDKYGISAYTFEVLEETTKKQLDEREKYYINLFKACDYDKGYNVRGQIGEVKKEPKPDKKIAEKRDVLVPFLAPNELKQLLNINDEEYKALLKEGMPYWKLSRNMTRFKQEEVLQWLEDNKKQMEEVI